MGDLYVNLRNIRIRSGFSQQDVANYLGITRQAYSHYEVGRRKPDYEVLLKLSEFFGVSVADIIGSSMETSVLLRTESDSNMTLSTDEIMLIQKFRRLDERGKSAVWNTLDHEYELTPGEQTDAPAKNA